MSDDRKSRFIPIIVISAIVGFAAPTIMKESQGRPLYGVLAIVALAGVLIIISRLLCKGK